MSDRFEIVTAPILVSGGRRYRISLVDHEKGTKETWTRVNRKDGVRYAKNYAKRIVEDEIHMEQPITRETF